MRSVTKRGLVILLTCGAMTACSGTPDHILVKSGPEGAVSLDRVSSRGTTVRYSGQVNAFRASHPVSIPPPLLERVLRGIQVGITPSDGTTSVTAIKPTPVFSPKEAAFLAPAIAAALDKAEPDQRVKVEVGPETDRTDATLYVDGRTLRFALHRFHAPAHRKDGNLPIYILSVKPEQAQADSTGERYWMDIDSGPRLAVHYAVFERLVPPTDPPPLLTPSASSSEREDMHTMKEVVDKQAQELESLKAELESLKKHMQEQAPRPTTAP